VSDPQHTEPDADAPVAAPPQQAVRSELVDGEWHRMHPLSPLLRGGLAMLVILGIVVTNLRDRLIGIFLPDGGEYSGDDPVDFIIENNVALPAIGITLGLLIVIIALFWVSWRFHTFRITGDDVEVRSGVLFRTHRRAPLDRVQGVNLTRPALARLVGLAKLEVVGAGLDSNVKLEYLSTANSETIRGDILRLASGRQKAEKAEKARAQGQPVGAAAASAPQGTVGRISAGLGEIVDGVDDTDSAPESIVRVPLSRLILANLLSGSTLIFLALIIAVIVGLVLQPQWLFAALGASIPAAIGFGGYAIRQFVRSIRYSIAPTSAGVRITFGLLTTVTETLPTGRVHAVDIRQPVLWRWGGWWKVRVNRVSGSSATDASAAQNLDVLPIGTRADVERVVALLLPSVPVDAAMLADGMIGPREGDGYTVSPRRARWFKPLSYRRNGFRLLPEALLIRRGRIWPKLVLLPLARLQSVRIDQGALDRRLGLANVTGHTVLGPVAGHVNHLDRGDAIALWQATTEAAVTAAEAVYAPSVEVEWGEDAVAPVPASDAAPEPAVPERPDA
jgi:putative membrane protein